MTKRVFFDMDGTFANLYGVDGWLDYLIAGDATPYAICPPLYEISELVNAFALLVENGYEINIISWLAKNSTKEYDAKVREAKRNWLERMGLAQYITHTRITPYGVCKSTTCKKYGDGILFDDEVQNRNAWKLGATVDAKNENIIDVINELCGAC